jgi:Na+/melibiose symporter-like transporter
MVSRILDGVFDPVIGMVADRTKRDRRSCFNEGVP